VNSIETLFLFTAKGMPWTTTTNLEQIPTYLAALHWLYDNGFYSVGLIWTNPFGPVEVDTSSTTRLLMGYQVLALDQISVMGGTLNSVTQGLDSALGQIESLQASTGGVTAAWVEQLFNNAVADAEELFNDEVSWRTTAVANAEQQATAQVQQAEQQATAQYNQAVSYSQQLYNQAVAHADQDMAAAEQQATNQHNQAEQDAQNAANQAQSNAQGYTDGAVRGAEALAAAALALQVASDAVEFATLTAGVAAVADLAGDAIMANGLLQLLEAGALFGFLALAIKEPVGTANVSVGVLDPLLDQAGALVDDVIGFLV
jgi:vacuolar-type H+-ATPase subunit H